MSRAKSLLEKTVCLSEKKMMKEHYNNHSGSATRNTGSGRHANHQQNDKKGASTKGKTEWRKTAIRICGDWSEQLSSKSKIYYYNCTTEVSQWQKPKEWTLPDVPRQQLIDSYNKRLEISKEGQSIKRTHPIPNLETRSVSRPHGVGGSSSASAQNYHSPKRARYGEEQSHHSMNSALSSRVPQNSHPSTISHNQVSGSRYPPSYNHLRGSVTTRPREVPSGSYRGTSSGAPAANDDMDISPNSSPLSGGSCSPIPTVPDRTIQHHKPSSSPPRRRPDIRTQVGPSNNTPQQKPASSRQSGEADTLRRMLDSLKDALTVVLTRPPASNASSVTAGTTARVTTSHPAPSPHHYHQPHNHNPSLTGMGMTMGPPTTSPAPFAPVMRSYSSSSGAPVTSSAVQHSNADVVARIANLLSGPTPPALSSRQVDDLIAQLESINQSHHSSPSSLPSPAAHRGPPGYQRHHSADYDLRRGGFSGGRTCGTDRYSEMIRLLHELQSNLQTNPSSRDSFRQLASQLQKYFEEMRGSSSLSGSREDRTISSFSPAHQGDSRRHGSPQPNGHSGESHTSSALGDPSSSRINGGGYLDSTPLKPSAGAILDSPDILRYVDTTISTGRFLDPLGSQLEQAANMEAQKFDKLHTVLYGELSGELKKLRALVRISEVKTSIHHKKKEVLEELMEMLEVKKPMSSFLNITNRT